MDKKLNFKFAVDYLKNIKKVRVHGTNSHIQAIPLEEKTRVKKGIFEKFQKISIKLIIGLLTPVILLAIYGAVSYQKSEDAIITNYEESTSDTINVVRDFLDFGFNIVEQKGLKYQCREVFRYG